MQNLPISVALLISTYNWPEALELILISVTRQSRMPDEIVIADDGSREETKLLIEKFKSEFNLPIRHVWHEDKGFRKTIIINKAVKQITSDYIIEIDGDMIIDAHFIADHLNAAKTGYFIQGSRAMIIESEANRVLQTKQTVFSVFSSALSSRFNALRVPLLSPLIMLLPSNPFHIKACNIAFWRGDFLKINGYDNRFEGWGGEDYEFGARLLHAGIKRKRLKMAALAYHLYHRISSQENTVPNDKIYRKTLSEKSTYTTNGYQEA